MLTAHHDRTYRRYQPSPHAVRGAADLRWYCVAALAVGLLASLAYVRCSSGQERMGRRLQGVSVELRAKVKEAENLRVELERLKSGKHILTAVARLKLGLRRPETGQVRRVGLPESPGPGEVMAREMVVRN